MGRPRSLETMRAIHNATMTLLRRDGYGALTFERIAREAGAGRQTIYRWWPSKADLVLDAANSRAEELVQADDLETFVRRTYAAVEMYEARVLAVVMAEAQLDPAFGARFRTEFLERRRAALKVVAARELPPGTDLDIVADLVFGPLWYLVLTRPSAASPGYAEHVLAALRGYAARLASEGEVV
jgi:AcrR family transcriptional regulator